jgi:hypothetical protein
MRKWEYRTLRTFDEAELNQLGAEGWELVGIAMAYVDGVGSEGRAIFKRPKQ